ncbi:unnamed protein product [Paramecium primaurelia]|uniref:P-loop containing nucleoside triphosphate hydrolase n=2 Tax=Paramecium TaxID=5884 RepID=A0A8S1Y1U7_9CILI|nr:unnamed protein product [Paramecium primaurelia]CAD8207315.1 unnamed protein product [Paramecium pentaurelia]
MSYSYLFKFILIGDTGVGKSCLLLQFIDKRFRQKHEVTIGVEFGAKLIELDGLNIKLQIWDTAGQESFRSITRSYYRSAAGAIVVYDITKRESYENVARWMEEVKQNGNPKLSMLLVGNKGDLESERQISYNEAQQFAKECGIDFFETSAKTSNNVEEIFTKMAQIILEKINLGQIDPKNENFGIKLGSEQVNYSHGNQNITNLEQQQEYQPYEEKKKSNMCC